MKEMQDAWVRSLSQEDILEKEMATHPSILAWRIPWTEPGGLQSTESQRVRHDLATKQQQYSIVYMYCIFSTYASVDLSLLVNVCI